MKGRLDSGISGDQRVQCQASNCWYPACAEGVLYMAATGVCPEPQVLQQLALRRLPPAELERLAAHCGQCDRCLATLQRLHARDTLAGTPGAAIHALIARLDALPPAGGNPEDEVTRATLTDPTPS